MYSDPTAKHFHLPWVFPIISSQQAVWEECLSSHSHSLPMLYTKPPLLKLHGLPHFCSTWAPTSSYPLSLCVWHCWPRIPYCFLSQQCGLLLVPSCFFLVPFGCSFHLPLIYSFFFSFVFMLSSVSFSYYRILKSAWCWIHIFSYIPFERVSLASSIHSSNSLYPNPHSICTSGVHT